MFPWVICFQMEIFEPDVELIDDSAEYIDKKEEKANELYNKIKINQEHAHKKQQEHYERRNQKGIKSFTLQEGQAVLKRRMKNVTRKGGKYESLWDGPFKYVNILMFY